MRGILEKERKGGKYGDGEEGRGSEKEEKSKN